MLRILEAQAPAKQNATDTISTLSSRLQSVTLLEDRRAAILGLRSFAKLYPASVASGALRDLIACLRRDGEDADTSKVVLETLLMLFEPDTKSLEASDEITLWMADEFTQRQDNVTALLDLLESAEFYLRLYAVQILSHVSTARPERTQEVIFTAPLGVSRLVAVLDDRREAVRNEALLLLVALTPASAELQKVVAFENAFDRIFKIMETEGSLTHGSSTVQDCLSLLANLLRLNVSNQSYFREIGCIAKVSRLLSDVSKQEVSEDGVSDWIKPQRDMNVWGLLAVVQLLLVKRGQGTALNQAAFWQSKGLLFVLQLSFNPAFSVSIRAKALSTCADLIRSNSSIQEQFGDLTVPKFQPDSPSANGSANPTPAEKAGKTANGDKAVPQSANVIEVLLQLVLEPAPTSLFDVRLAACNCLKAFFEGHDGIRAHVLKRAIEGHASGDDAIPNIISVLFDPAETRSKSDPYQVWMASVLLLHLLFENADTKASALDVQEGDAENGEEVITFVQGVTGNILSSVRHIENERSLAGYLMLLCVWLFEEPEAVNDLLSEGSNVQGLIQAVKITSNTMPLVAGLCSLLLGIIYEFSSKDSPIPRSTLHGLLAKNLTREVYVDRLTKLRENPFIRDFEVLPQSNLSSRDGGLPEVFFDGNFVEFLKDNFSRLLRAIDRDPNFEVSIIANGVQKGVSRELVDSLRAQLDDRTISLQNAESEILILGRKLEQEELDHRRTRDSAAVEVNRIKQINKSLQDNHEDELKKLDQSHAKSRSEIAQIHQKALQDADHRFRQFSVDSEMKSAKSRERNEAEITDLKKTADGLRARIAKSDKDHIQDLQTAHEEYSAKLENLESRLKRAEEKAAEATERAEHLSKQLENTRFESTDLRKQLEEKDGARKDVQTELDDLLVVFADLEAKRAGDKSRLKALGEDVSEDEDDAGGEDDESEAEHEETSDVD